MAECTTPAQISESDYEAARAAGLLIVTVAEEVAAHKFAEAIRAPLVKTLRDMDGWLANTGHAETHPWRISIRAALARCASTATAPMQGEECPQCRSIEWDRVTVERGRERDVPFNRCASCGNEWETQ